MEVIGDLPAVGWIVIGFIALLIFILLWTRGIKLGSGEKFISVGNTVDRKLADFKIELEKQKLAARHDDELRKKLYRQSLSIDDRLKADMRRVVRALDEVIYSIFAKYTKCEFPAVMIENVIKGELFQRLDDNCMRERLSKSEREGYLYDIRKRFEDKYQLFLSKLKTTNCAESYPSWDDVADGVTIMLNSWADQTTAEITFRIREKIAAYSAERGQFQLEEYKKDSIDDPIAKNEAYLLALEGTK